METLPPAVSRMNLEHLKTFHYVAQSGSFTRAAQLLFLTQPAVSQQMQGLENALHVALFDRSRRSIALSRARVPEDAPFRGVRGPVPADGPDPSTRPSTGLAPDQ